LCAMETHAPNPAFGSSTLRLTEVTVDKKSQILISCLALCILGGATFLTIALISPPAPLPADIPATEFSAGRAMQDLEIIGWEPHPMGVFPAHASGTRLPPGRDP